MPNYTGYPCKVCQNLFREGDDIVVCPECGTPYHRSCYQAKGQCINFELHECGGSWQRVNSTMLHDRRCPNCHHINAPDATYCPICHTVLRVEPKHEQSAPKVSVVLPSGKTMHFSADDPCCGMPEGENFGGERLDDIACFIGHNTLYYVPLFKRFKDSGKKASFNFPCFFFPHLYFANRKVWPMTLLSILVLTLCRIPAMLMGIQETLTDKNFIKMYEDYGMDVTEMFGGILAFVEAHAALINVLDIVCYVLQLVFCLLMCLFGNYIYYRHVIKKVRTTAVGSSPQVRRMFMRREGGTSFWCMLGALALNYAAAMAVMTVILMLFM